MKGDGRQWTNEERVERGEARWEKPEPEPEPEPEPGKNVEGREKSEEKEEGTGQR